MMRWAVLAAAASLLSLPQLASAAPPANVFQCSRSRPVVDIDARRYPSGVLETPNFPGKFPLSLNCAWVFTNTGDSRAYVHLYFTQYFLAPGFLGISTPNRTELRAWRSRGNLRSRLTGEVNENWQKMSYLNASNEHMVLRLDVPMTGLDRVHWRALDVYGSYGFRIAYEVRRGPRRNDLCSTVRCNMNGECIADFTPDGKNISGFACDCAFPVRPQVVDKRFHGPLCQYHAILNECDAGKRRQGCSNHGECRHVSNRFMVCDCDKGYTGRYCETPVSREASVGESSHKPCGESYVSVWVHRNLAEIRDLLMSEYRNTVVRPGVHVYEQKDSNGTGGRLFFYARHTKMIYEVKKGLKEFRTSSARLKRRRLANVSSIVGAPEFGGLCTRDLETRPSLPVRRSNQVHLSCIVTGVGRRNKFVWYKDSKFWVNETLSKRFMATDVSYVDGETIGVLIIHDAGEWDNGRFYCGVRDLDLSCLRRVDLRVDGCDGDCPPDNCSSVIPKTVTQSVEVVVATEPKVEVFPMSLTVVSNEAQSKPTSRTLHCLAEKNVPLETAANYDFEWLRNGRKIDGDDDLFVEEVYAPSRGQKLVSFGLLLKLGNLQEKANFTCEVRDRRAVDSRELSASDVPLTSVTVPVLVADDALALCDDQRAESGMFWPRTLKGEEAIRPCPFGQEGFVRHKCEQTNNVTRGFWSNVVDRQGCVQVNISMERDIVGAFMSGFVADGDDGRVLTNFTAELPGRTKARRLYKSEWDIVLGLARNILDYMRPRPSKSIGDFSRHFFNTFVPWLSKSAQQLTLTHSSLGKTPNDQLIDLVRKATELFMTKLHPGSNLTLVAAPDGIPRDCPRPVIAAMARLEVGNGRWGISNRKLPFNFSLPRILPTRRRSCTGDDRASVEVSVSSEAMQVAGAALGPGNLSIAAIHYGGLDRTLRRRNHFAASWSSGRNSSVVTVMVDFEAAPDNKQLKRSFNQRQLKFTIRFSDFRFLRNDTAWQNLSCGRLNLDQEGSSTWSFNVPDCFLGWETGGLTCSCKRSGSYALMWSKPPTQERFLATEDISPESLGSGGCLTVSLLTLLVLLRQQCKAGGKRPAGGERGSAGSPPGAQCLTTAAVAALMGLIIFASTDPSHDNWWMSLVLQYILLLLLLLQIWTLLAIQCQLGDFSRPAIVRRTTYTVCFLIPMLYCLAVYFIESKSQRLEKIHVPAASEPSSLPKSTPHVHSWFVSYSSADFNWFVGTCSFITGAYLVLFVFTARKVRALNEAKVEQLYGSRSQVLVRSGIVFTAVLLFTACCLVYENFVGGAESYTVKVVFCLACIGLGVVVFLCYLVSSEGYMAQRTLSNLRWSCKPNEFTRTPSGDSTTKSQKRMSVLAFTPRGANRRPTHPATPGDTGGAENNPLLVCTPMSDNSTPPKMEGGGAHVFHSGGGGGCTGTRLSHCSKSFVSEWKTSTMKRRPGPLPTCADLSCSRGLQRDSLCRLPTRPPEWDFTRSGSGSGSTCSNWMAIMRRNNEQKCTAAADVHLIRSTSDGHAPKSRLELLTEAGLDVNPNNEMGATAAVVSVPRDTLEKATLPVSHASKTRSGSVDRRQETVPAAPVVTANPVDYDADYVTMTNNSTFKSDFGREYGCVYGGSNNDDGDGDSSCSGIYAEIEDSAAAVGAGPTYTDSLLMSASRKIRDRTTSTGESVQQSSEPESSEGTGCSTSFEDRDFPLAPANSVALTGDISYPTAGEIPRPSKLPAPISSSGDARRVRRPLPTVGSLPAIPIH